MLYSKKDLINAINDYIEVLKFDIKITKNQLLKEVMLNILNELTKIIITYRR